MTLGLGFSHLLNGGDHVPFLEHCAVGSKAKSRGVHIVETMFVPQSGPSQGLGSRQCVIHPVITERGDINPQAAPGSSRPPSGLRTTLPGRGPLPGSALSLLPQQAGHKLGSVGQEEGHIVEMTNKPGGCQSTWAPQPLNKEPYNYYTVLNNIRNT